MADMAVAEPREAVLGSGAGGPLAPPTPWITEKDVVSAYVQYPAGVLIGGPAGGNKGIGALNLQYLYINGAQFLPANYLLLAGGTLTGPLIQAADPVNALGTATKQYVDGKVTTINATFGNYLPLAGGTLTGSLIMSTGTSITLAADPAANLEAATKQYVDLKFSGLIGINDAPADGTIYGRKDNNWTNVMDLGTY